jgi:branched-chain amino acid transport system ATP-binding protein
VNAFYDKSHVLKDLSFSIESGEAVAMLGRNGAGKTTTIRSIMNVADVSVTGDIRYDGTEITDLSPEETAPLGIGWVPETRRVFPNLTVKENLRMGQIRADEADLTLEQIYSFFPRLEDRTTQMGGTLSGGEQQMLAIARVLLTNPDLLLVDEPFEGLMPSLIDELVDILADLVDRGYSMLLVEQKPEEALPLTGEAIILETGEIEYKSSSKELLENRELLERHIGVSR